MLGRVRSLEAVCWDAVLIGLDICLGALDAGGRRDFFCRKENPFPLSSMLKLYPGTTGDVGAGGEAWESLIGDYAAKLRLGDSFSESKPHSQATLSQSLRNL